METGDPVKEVVLQPNWVMLAETFAAAIITHSVDEGSEGKVLHSLCDIIRYLSVADPPGLKKFMGWLDDQASQAGPEYRQRSKPQAQPHPRDSSSGTTV